MEYTHKVVIKESASWHGYYGHELYYCFTSDSGKAYACHHVAPCGDLIDTELVWIPVSLSERVTLTDEDMKHIAQLPVRSEMMKAIKRKVNAQKRAKAKANPVEAFCYSPKSYWADASIRCFETPEAMNAYAEQHPEEKVIEYKPYDEECKELHKRVKLTWWYSYSNPCDPRNQKNLCLIRDMERALKRHQI